jgi:hypothetical protein
LEYEKPTMIFNLPTYTGKYDNEKNRQQIYELLSINGYSRLQDRYTGQEDWYIKL